jgi:hypothetical protein
MEFRSFGKIARYNRQIVITEKIDGTNACVVIDVLAEHCPKMPNEIARVGNFAIYAQSRTRMITPEDDNFGFAQWVRQNAENLCLLGVGHHFGEWWGSGIQRGYGLSKGERRFSLFNAGRWVSQHTLPKDMAGCSLGTSNQLAPESCHVVPILWRGNQETNEIACVMENLRINGSRAAPGFMNPEGVIIYHSASGTYYKKTLTKDDEPKSAWANIVEKAAA